MQSLTNNRRIFRKRFSHGFSLIELIIVIVLIGVLSISLGNITSFSVYSYIDAKDRNQLSQASKWLIERISREAREALPQSMRAGSNGNVYCVEFMRILNASTYINLPAGGPISTIDAVGFDLTYSAGMLVAIMPINPSQTYSGGGTLGTVASITPSGSQVQISLTGPTVFARRSPQNRFYLLSSPISFCLDDGDGDVTIYTDYGLNNSQAFPPVGGTEVAMAENISASGAVFNYQPGSLSRSGLLQINFRMQNRNRNLSGDSESFEVFHEVHVRNAP